MANCEKAGAWTQVPTTVVVGLVGKVAKDAPLVNPIDSWNILDGTCKIMLEYIVGIC